MNARDLFHCTEQIRIDHWSTALELEYPADGGNVQHVGTEEDQSYGTSVLLEGTLAIDCLLPAP